jgi:Leucine-rich repeat (LRR) protein
LACEHLRVADFSPIANAPIEELFLNDTPVDSLSFLRRMPLRRLSLSQCKEARGYEALCDVKSLEKLLLPSSIALLPLRELAAIQALRKLPSLCQVQVGSGGVTTLDPWSWSDQQTSAESWTRFERDLQTLKALQQIEWGPVACSRGKNWSWIASFEDRPISDLSPLAEANLSELNLNSTGIRDLGPLKGKRLAVLLLRNTPVSNLMALRGAPLKALDISGTEVSDLSPLEGMSLTALRLQATKIIDLGPLRSLPLRELSLNGCRAEIDLSPLAEIATLQQLTLPSKPKNLESLRNLPNLRFLSYEVDPELKRPVQTAKEFWSAQNTAPAGH